MTFDETYKKLNTEQREAVDTIDGPLLVIAGPGTGKTQLLSARVANILRQTDAMPENILCLTYTENGAENMRERLNSLIGADSHRITVSTYHGFGQEIISKNRDYFSERSETAIDELGQHRVLRKIVDSLAENNLLKWIDINDLRGAIGECKKAGLEPDAMRRIAKRNIESETKVNQKLDIALKEIRGKRKLSEVLPTYKKVLEIMKKNVTDGTDGVRPSLEIYADSLEEVISFAEDTKPLTAWKNANTSKNGRDEFELKNAAANKKLLALADVYEKYHAELSNERNYDFDDMVLETIAALKKHDDLRFALQEQYQYILLDEYQDTNKSQAEIVWLLTNNPICEGRPNVMAVGDDDQAIMAFQGAESSNLSEFAARYRDTKVINLLGNYRSSQDILDFAAKISGQIESKPDLAKKFSGSLKAKNEPIESEIERVEFINDIAECRWVAKKIAEIPSEEWCDTAVILPKHRLLKKLLPYLREKNIAVSYEQRENILDSKTIQQITQIAELVNGLLNEESKVRYLWPRVLSQEYWEIDAVDIWNLSWAAKEEKRAWHELALESANEKIRKAAELILKLVVSAETESFETILGMIVGAKIVDGAESPFKKYYLTQPDDVLYDVVSALTILRDKYNENSGKKTLAGFLEFVDAYRAAEIAIINSNPYREGLSAVNLMTAHKAKGLEFKHVFLPFLNGKEWGKSSGNDNRISLPNNLRFVRRSSIEGDERLRVLFVAITRTKSYLYMTNSALDFTGDKMGRLGYLCERENSDGETTSDILPEKYAKVVKNDDSSGIELADLERTWTEAWRDRHLPTQATMKDLLAKKIDRIRYAPSHLTSFFDTKYGGPRAFYENIVLQFPSSRGLDAEFGNAVHDIFSWYATEIKAGREHGVDHLIERFNEYVSEVDLSFNDTQRLLERGERQLPKYFEKRSEMLLMRNVETEVGLGFGSERLRLDGVLIAGRVDRLEIDDEKKMITIVDFKTGKPKSEKAMAIDLKLHKCIYQMYVYKMLLNRSLKSGVGRKRRYADYKIERARIEFVGVDEDGEASEPLEIMFTMETEKRVESLLKTMDAMIKTLDFPEVDGGKYKGTTVGMKKFEDDLIDRVMA